MIWSLLIGVVLVMIAIRVDHPAMYAVVALLLCALALMPLPERFEEDDE